MSNYSLNINFDPVSLRKLHENGSRVILVKSVGNINSSANVVWLTFNPVERNIISWEEDYSAYLSAGLTSAEAEASAVEGFNERESSGPAAPINYLSHDVVVNGEVIRGTPFFQASIQQNQVDSMSSNSEAIAVCSQEVTESGILKDSQPHEISFHPNTAELTIKYDHAAGGFINIK